MKLPQCSICTMLEPTCDAFEAEACYQSSCYQLLAGVFVCRGGNSTTKANRMSNARMNMQGLLAILEDEEVNLVGRKETRFSSVPLTGVQLEVLWPLLDVAFNFIVLGKTLGGGG